MNPFARLLVRWRIAKLEADRAWGWPADVIARAEANLWLHRLLVGREPSPVIVSHARSDTTLHEALNRVLLLRPGLTSELASTPCDGSAWLWPTTHSARREAVIWAYRILLGREPDTEAAILEKVERVRDLKHLRTIFFASEEYALKAEIRPQFAMTGYEPPQSIEVDVDPGTRDALFARVQRVWQGLGESEAHWSVATLDDFRPDKIEQSLETFFATGERDIHQLWCTLSRCGIDTAAIRSAMDFGCGVGRLSVALSRRLSEVHAVDVSQGHLDHAMAAVSSRGRNVVAFHAIRTIDAVNALPKVDLVFSVIVLQHNPPPVMKVLFTALLKRLNSKGVAVVQMPTYLPERYRFQAKEYLSSHEQGMEMHAIPQREVFRVIHESDCEILEILEDNWTGMGTGARSNTFVIARR
jgi:2-polyprenyl-3-methyl-5-hydroxy-6-metoxy-1,4-benzoquinol methylase